MDSCREVALIGALRGWVGAIVDPGQLPIPARKINPAEVPNLFHMTLDCLIPSFMLNGSWAEDLHEPWHQQRVYCSSYPVSPYLPTKFAAQKELDARASRENKLREAMPIQHKHDNHM